jgi:hypothetical protein
MKSNQLATFYVDVHKQPEKPNALKSSNLVRSSQSKRQQPIALSEQKKACVLCILQQNKIAKSYGQLFTKFA